MNAPQLGQKCFASWHEFMQYGRKQPQQHDKLKKRNLFNEMITKFNINWKHTRNTKEAQLNAFDLKAHIEALFECHGDMMDKVVSLTPAQQKGFEWLLELKMQIIYCRNFCNYSIIFTWSYNWLWLWLWLRTNIWRRLRIPSILCWLWTFLHITASYLLSEIYWYFCWTTMNKNE